VWVISVLIVPSVFDLIWGVWDFPVENREKLSVLTLNKLGFVNDVEGCFGFSGGWFFTSLHVEVVASVDPPAQPCSCP
jgi:hypothetical protein